MLTDAVAIFHYEQEGDSVFAQVVARVNALGIEIHSCDPVKRKIVVRCLSKILDMLVWRCWSDRLVIQVRQLGPGRSTLEMSALPNLFRYKVGRGERLCDIEALVAELRNMHVN